MSGGMTRAFGCRSRIYRIDANRKLYDGIAKPTGTETWNMEDGEKRILNAIEMR